jgi:hypothetical protein
MIDLPLIASPIILSSNISNIGLISAILRQIILPMALLYFLTCLNQGSFLNWLYIFKSDVAPKELDSKIPGSGR